MENRVRLNGLSIVGAVDLFEGCSGIWEGEGESLKRNYAYPQTNRYAPLRPTNDNSLDPRVAQQSGWTLDNSDPSDLDPRKRVSSILDDWKLYDDEGFELKQANLPRVELEAEYQKSRRIELVKIDGKELKKIQEKEQFQELIKGLDNQKCNQVLKTSSQHLPPNPQKGLFNLMLKPPQEKAKKSATVSAAPHQAPVPQRGEEKRRMPWMRTDRDLFTYHRGECPDPFAAQLQIQAKNQNFEVPPIISVAIPEYDKTPNDIVAEIAGTSGSGQTRTGANTPPTIAKKTAGKPLGKQAGRKTATQPSPTN